jgi:hypothetical protein
MDLYTLESLAAKNGIECKYFNSEQTAIEYYTEQLNSLVNTIMVTYIESSENYNTFVRCDCGYDIRRNKKVSYNDAIQAMNDTFDYWFKSVFKLDDYSFFKDSWLSEQGIVN